MKPPNQCVRCGFNGKDFKMIRSIACPYCGNLCFRIKALYRKVKRDYYYCTNESCNVKVVVISATWQQNPRSYGE